MKRIGLILLVIYCSSCSLFYRSALGIDSTPEWLTNKSLVKEFDKQEIPLNNRYVLDTTSYKKAISNNLKENSKNLELSKKEDSTYKTKLYKIAKDDLQPVQVRYFDSDYNQIFKIVNCYIDNPLSMNWNVNNCFDVYPPKIDIEDLNNDKKKLVFFLEHIYTLDNNKISLKNLLKSDYYVIVFWNSFFKRPSKKLITTIKEFENKNKDKNTYILYVNNQNSEIWSSIDDAQKREILK